MSLSKESLVGSLIEGRYQIESELGAGGMGAVYLARDLKVLGRSVVVKVLLAESYQNEYVVKKFRQEAEALSRLDHPNVVGILDYGEMEGGQPYLVLQFIDGVSLGKVLQTGAIELERAAPIIRQVSHALTAAHEKGILHRDLKPDNVMLQTLGGEERVIVIDFGIAQVQDSVIAPKTAITTTAGTIFYMSPEQLSAGTLTTASDTYALGVIAYELVTGQKPFNPKSPYQLLEMQRAGVSVPPRQLRPDLPEAAQAAILKALAYEASERYQRTRDFGREFYLPIAEATGMMTGQFDSTNAGIHLTTEPSRSTNVNLKPRSTNVIEGTEAPTHAFPSGGAGLPDVPVGPAGRRQGPNKLLIGVVALLLVAVVGVGGFVAWRLTQKGQARPEQAAPTAAPSDAGGGAGGTAAAPEELVLNYSLTVQRVRDGKEYKEPFESTGRDIFENGWLFRMNVSTPRPGYLYLLNEGLNEAGVTAYTVLFPTHGDARINAGQRVQIPEENYYEFTGSAGTEKIWVVWAVQPVPEMEALKGLFNPKDQGEVRDPARIRSVREFLSGQASARPEVIEDKANKRTTVKAAGGLMVHLSELEHH